jgi:hypothetical protein
MVGLVLNLVRRLEAEEAVQPKLAVHQLRPSEVPVEMG